MVIASKQYDKTLVLLIATLLFVRMAVVFVGYPLVTSVIPEWGWSNNDGYDSIAVNWVKTGVFGLQPGIPTAERLPLYPGIIAVSYLVAKTGLAWFTMFLQALLSTVSGYVLFKLTNLLFGRRPAVLSLLLFILHPQVNNFVFRCATETTFIFLLVMALYHVTRFQVDGRTRDIMFFAVWAGLAVLTRPVLATLLVFAFPLLFLAGIYNLMLRNFKVASSFRAERGISFGRYTTDEIPSTSSGQALRVAQDDRTMVTSPRPDLSARRRFYQVGMAVLVVLVILMPWFARNYFRSGYFPVLQTWVGQPLYQGTYVSQHLSEFLSNKKTISELDQTAIVEIRSAVQKFFKERPPSDDRPIAREVMADRYARILAYQRVLKDQLVSPGHFLRNLVLAPVLQMTWRSSAVLMVWNWPLLILSLLGLAVCFKKRRPTFMQALPLTIVFGWFLFIHALVWPQARYILPALVPFSSFAAFYLAEITAGFQKNKNDIVKDSGLER